MKAAQSWLSLSIALMGLALAACALPPDPTPSPVHTPTAKAAPTPTFTVTAPPPTPAPTPTPVVAASTPSPTPTIVWPKLEKAKPPAVAHGTEVRVSARGGYLFIAPSTYIEGDRSFVLYLDDAPAGHLTCYLRYCEGSLAVPGDAAPGVHEVSTEGGSVISITVATLHTMAEAIGWLQDAGLRAEVVEGAGPGVSNPDRQVQLDGSPVRVSVDGYDRVWIFAFQRPMDHQEAFRFFDLSADFTAKAYPTVFQVGSIAVLVRGDDTDVLEKVFVSLWDRTPIHDLTPFGIWPLAPSSGDADRGRWLTWVKELAARWLSSPQRGERAVSLVANAEVRLVRLGDYLARFPASDGPYPRLPHPDTLVWAVATRWEVGNAVVLLDAWNYIVVGAAYTPGRLLLEEVPEVPIPGPVKLTSTDGAWSEHDELAAIISWPEPAEVRFIPNFWHERVDIYVIERAPGQFGPWETLAVVSRKGYSGPHAGTFYLLTPPEGRAIISGPKDSAIVRYWDWDVEQGVQYSYRVYGCTSLGRRTPVSNVAQAVAGDPLPDTPHPYAHPSPTPVEPPC